MWNDTGRIVHCALIMLLQLQNDSCEAGIFVDHTHQPHSLSTCLHCATHTYTLSSLFLRSCKLHAQQRPQSQTCVRLTAAAVTAAAAAAAAAAERTRPPEDKQ